VIPGRYLMLAVTDDGCGMDQNTRQRIFEPFFTTKGVGKGTGLGLATVYGIVQQHGGSVWVYSEPNRGTTFKCYFPLVDESPVGEQPPVYEQQLSLVVGRRTILLVEDNEMVRTLVHELLTRQGFEVLVAEEPEQALLISENRSLDLLVTDVVMPGLDPEGPIDFDNAKKMLIEIATASCTSCEYDVILDVRKARSELTLADLWYLAVELSDLLRHFLVRPRFFAHRINLMMQILLRLAHKTGACSSVHSLLLRLQLNGWSPDLKSHFSLYSRRSRSSPF